MSVTSPQAIARILFDQGFGTRRLCEGMVLGGTVSIGGRVIDDPAEPFVAEGLAIVVDGQPWHCHAQALVMLHKPTDRKSVV